MHNNIHETGILKPEHPILIVEDEKKNQDLLTALCKKAGADSMLAGNGKEALELIENNSFSIYIVDLMMPVMDGKVFIEHLKKKIPDAIILVQSALDSPDIIINIMKQNIYDYILKPIVPETFIKTLRRAMEHKYLIDTQHTLESSASLKIRNQLEWLNYKEKRRITGKDHAEIKSIYNLKTSLMQGTGFGSLLTLINLIKTSIQDNGDSYIVDKTIIDLLIRNLNICETQLNGLHLISGIMEKDFTLDDCDAYTLISAIPGILSDVTPHLLEKNI